MGCLPSGAMSGHDDVRRQPSEAVEGGVDDRLEQRAVEVEAADDRADLLNSTHSRGLLATYTDFARASTGLMIVRDDIAKLDPRAG
jgi:hypothetical protein